jgi:spore coat protein CotH
LQVAGWQRQFLLPFALCAVFCALTLPTPAGNHHRDSGSPGDDIFAGTNVLRIQIEIPRTGMEALRRTGWGNGERRPHVSATVREGERVYTNVQVHLKGAAGSFRSLDDNPGLTLNFDKLAPGQSFHGLHKISLNNSVQDRSFLSEKICRELFDASGVPVPRAGHAKVMLNNRDLGIHVLVEAFNKQFLKRYYKNTQGNLYDGGFLRDVSEGLHVNSGDNRKEHPGLHALMEALNEQDPAQRMAALERTLDMDRFLSFIAMDVMQCDWDGYYMSHNNWRLYHDLDSNKMVFFPHGLDQMFGVERVSPDCQIVPRAQGLVARVVMNSPGGRRRYLERMSQLYSNVWHVDALLKRVDDLAAVIRPAIAESSASAARRHDEQIQWLKERIRQRDESLRRQLSALAVAPKFDSTGAMKLVGWRQVAQAGQAEFRQEKSAEGNNILYIGARNGNVRASWRSKVLLDTGVYRFEGMLRTSAVKLGSAPFEGGAGFRISRGAIPQGLSGTQEWRRFTYSFEVPEGGKDVDLVCELRATGGEAWFDTSSLRIVRLRDAAAPQE